LEKRKLEQEGHAAMSEKSKLEGQCWLCGRWRELTREHIPPRSAFNNHPILLYTVEENVRRTGRIEWAGRVEKGLVVRSLCGECNSRGGGQYGSHYADFIARVAPAVERARDREQIIISGVQRPLSILKQIMQTFVSANGPDFVAANPWIRRFIRDSKNKEWPQSLFAYLFATNSRECRKSGLSAFYDFGEKRIRTVAEFSFWPLGMVLSFDPLDDYPLTPIHQWASFDYGWERQLDLNLTVNPTSSAYALDFRTRDEINKDALHREERPTVAGDKLKELIKLAQDRGGGAKKDTWAYFTKTTPTIEE
jgi:hypothetical protein